VKRDRETIALIGSYGGWMGVVRRATTGRWAVALAGTVAIGFLPTALRALPAAESTRTPRQLVAQARASAAIPHEGYVETTGSLGLPDLPRLGQVAALLGGTTHARVWWRSATAWRVDRVTPTGESDTYATGKALQTWDFESHRARFVFSASPVRLPRLDDLLPPQAARRIVAGLSPADLLTALPARRIAGRSADGVRIVPATSVSTVGQVDVYVDTATGLPLSLQVYPRGSAHAALTTRFLDVRLGRPDDSTVAPHVPRDARVDSVTLPDIAAGIDVYAPFALPARLGTFSRSRNLVSLGGTASYGEGLAGFVVLPLPPDLGRSALAAARDGGGLELAISGGSAVLVGTPLLNAVIARSNTVAGGPPSLRGRSYLVAGLVDADTLTAAVTDLFADPPPRR
jgi:hypothetical protein